MNTFRLSDEAIGQIAKLVQLAILTGTDVVDNLRMMRLSSDIEDEENLILQDEYRGNADAHIQSLLGELEKNTQEA